MPGVGKSVSGYHVYKLFVCLFMLLCLDLNIEIISSAFLGSMVNLTLALQHQCICSLILIGQTVEKFLMIAISTKL